jgi:hypothetical protein
LVSLQIQERVPRSRFLYHTIAVQGIISALIHLGMLAFSNRILVLHSSLGILCTNGMALFILILRASFGNSFVTEINFFLSPEIDQYQQRKEIPTLHYLPWVRKQRLPMMLLVL